MILKIFLTYSTITGKTASGNGNGMSKIYCSRLINFHFGSINGKIFVTSALFFPSPSPVSHPLPSILFQLHFNLFMSHLPSLPFATFCTFATLLTLSPHFSNLTSSSVPNLDWAVSLSCFLDLPNLTSWVGFLIRSGKLRLDCTLAQHYRDIAY